MACFVESGFGITINSYKHSSFRAICIGSLVDIRFLGWILGNQSPMTRLTWAIGDTETIYMVRLLYPESYYIKLQLQKNMIQTKYRGTDIIEYLLTDSTHYGYYEEQENALKNEALMKFYMDMTIISIGIVTAAAVIIANSEEDDEK